MNATQQVKERRGARAHAHEAHAHAPENIGFHAAAGKNAQGHGISKLRLALGSKFSICQGIL